MTLHNDQSAPLLDRIDSGPSWRSFASEVGRRRRFCRCSWRLVLTACILSLCVVCLLRKVAEWLVNRCDKRALVVNGPFKGFSLHPKFPKAVCLDGSPGRYYYRKGYGSGENKWVFYFEGYNYCWTPEDCYDRTDYWFGSTWADSDYDAPSKRLSYWSPWQFDPSCVQNPLLYNWNHVLVRYCDGGYFSGDREEPVNVTVKKHHRHVQRKLYYRGRYITEGTIQDLNETTTLAISATDIVVSGCSSGGAHVIAHLDYLRSLLPSAARVVGFADSGFYLDVDGDEDAKEYIVDPKGQNGTAMLNQQCVANHTNDTQKCLMGVVSAAYATTPLYLWQSRYDSNQEMDCWGNRTCFLEYGENITTWINRTILSKPANGAFIDSCSRHCPSGIAKSDTDGKNVLEAFAEWYEGGARFNGQLSRQYPCKHCCN